MDELIKDLQQILADLDKLEMSAKFRVVTKVLKIVLIILADIQKAV